MTKPSLAVRRVVLNSFAVFIRQTSPSPARRVGALLCLVAFLMGNTDVIPLLTAFAAEMDAGHEVQFEHGESGVRVRLHHASAEIAGGDTQGRHQHGLMCELICGLWAQSGQEPDHLLAFAAEGTCEESEQLELASVKAPPYRPPSAPGVSLDMASTPSFFIRLVRAASSERANAPPPSSALRLARTVSLLI